MDQTNNFDFVNDTSLRSKILDAIEMTAILYLNLQKQSFSKLVSREIRRMIILYNASIVESLLLHLYKRMEGSLTKVKYINEQILINNLQKDTGGTIVIVEKINETRHDRELMLDILLKYFYQNGNIDGNLKDKIDNIKKVRNTFHLSKPRRDIPCGDITAQRSAEAVYETAQIVRNMLH